MEKENLIPVNDFCLSHHLEVSFIHTLEESGLVETAVFEQAEYLYPETLEQLEKLVRLHRELRIHPEDLDIVADLLNRMETLQENLVSLQRQISFYEQLEGQSSL